MATLSDVEFEPFYRPGVDVDGFIVEEQEDEHENDDSWEEEDEGSVGVTVVARPQFDIEAVATPSFPLRPSFSDIYEYLDDKRYLSSVHKTLDIHLLVAFGKADEVKPCDYQTHVQRLLTRPFWKFISVTHEIPYGHDHKIKRHYLQHLYNKYNPDLIFVDCVTKYKSKKESLRLNATNRKGRVYITKFPFVMTFFERESIGNYGDLEVQSDKPFQLRFSCIKLHPEMTRFCHAVVHHKEWQLRGDLWDENNKKKQKGDGASGRLTKAAVPTVRRS